MAARNINRHVNGDMVTTDTYDDGTTIVSTQHNAARLIQHVETSTYVNNKASRPVSPYTLNKEIWRLAPGFRKGHHGYPFPKYNSLTTGKTFMPYPPQPSLSDATRGAAINQALNGFKDGGLNVPVMVAEGNQTISMIASKLKAIRVFARWAKYGSIYIGRRNKIPRTELEIHNKWLELRWGWLPLMSDLYGLMSAFAGNMAWAEVRSVGTSKQRASGVFHRENYVCDYVTYYSRNGHHGVRFNYDLKKEYRCVLRGVLNSAPAAQAAALGFTNPLTVAWELVPFSCVADYFVSIGDFLSALDATNGYTFKSGSVTHYSNWSFNFSVDSLWDEYQMTNWYNDVGSGSYEKISLNREVLTKFPSPQLHFKNPFSVIQCANMLALLAQTFSNRR